MTKIVVTPYTKYLNKPRMVDGIHFDSTKEANRYKELKMLLKLGQISELELQKGFILIPSQYDGKRCIERAVKYICDFCYKRNGELVVEDVKSSITRKNKDYIIKRKLMLYIHHIKIHEI